MCGRFTQYQAEVRYLESLNWQAPLAFEPSDEAMARYNVAPTTGVRLLHLDADGLRISSVPWGYAPHWARGSGKRPPAINARLETAVTSKYWQAVWSAGRCLVPADGWYEWVKDPTDPKRKQPFYIKLKSNEPMFYAAIGHFPRGGEGAASEIDGFAIVTSASDQGMVDIHDRMPVVLPPEVAREWLDTSLPAHSAEDLARYHAMPVEAFEWYPVGKEVGNVRNGGSELIQPILGSGDTGVETGDK
ncbi:MAG: SOS response-associated peptidase family protein [Pseudomonas sp.]|nr:SOS response-associated peptidase family protein [Pseudomonas sp.]